MMKHDQSGLIDIFTEHLAEGRIVSAEYIFRESGQYTIKDKEHFLSILGGRYVDEC